MLTKFAWVWPFLYCLSHVGCIDLFTCENTVVTEVISYKRTHKAITFTRDCGATTGISHHVSVIPLDEELGTQPGNVLSAELGRVSAVPLLMAWPGDTLHIHLNAPVEVFKQEPSISGFSVQYTTGDGIDTKF